LLSTKLLHKLVKHLANKHCFELYTSRANRYRVLNSIPKFSKDPMSGPNINSEYPREQDRQGRIWKKLLPKVWSGSGHKRIGGKHQIKLDKRTNNIQNLYFLLDYSLMR